MPTSYTSLLGFALPATGELSGTWGTTVNDSITELVEDSIAATATASVTSGDWTLSTTGSGSANEARCAILRPTGSPGTTRNIIAPSQSKAYIIDNQSNGAVIIKGVATVGVTVPAGAHALVAFDGTDFVKVSNDVSNVTGTLPVANGGSGATTLTGVLKGNGTSAFTASNVALGSEVTGTLPVSNGGTGATTLTGVVKGTGTSALTAGTVSLTTEVTGTLPAANGGTGNTSYTDGQLLIGNTSTGGLSKATLTAGSGISVTNGNGSITIASSGGTGVASISFGSTGLTPNTATTGAVSVAGTLGVANGGTGATTLTGLIKGSGTSALSAAVSGTDIKTVNSTSLLGSGNVAVGTVTSVSVSAGTGMSGGGTVTSSGTITLTNAGVTSVTAGTGISVSASTGGVTITNTLPGASTGYGDVGTYIVAWTPRIEAGDSVAAGATVAASSLTYNSTNDTATAFNSNVNPSGTFTNLLSFSNSLGSTYYQALGLSGTWRYMTKIKANTSYPGHYFGLFLRIS